VRRTFLRRLGGVAMIAALVIPAAACQKSGDSGGNDGDCGGNLAIFGAFSGGNSGLVLPSRDAARLAVEKHNSANPDCKVELKEFDTEGDPAKATPAAATIVGDASILGVIGGHFSGETRATAPAYEGASLAMVAPSATAPDLSTKGWKVFHRVVGNDESQGPAAGNYIKTVLKSTKPYVVDDGTAYGAALANEVIKILGASTPRDKVQENQVDFAATVGKIKNSGADAVFYGGYTNEAAPFLKQLRQAGVTAKFIGGDGINDPNFPSGAGAQASEGAIITCPCLPPDKAKGSFAADFKTKYGAAPGVYAAEGWDATTVFLDAFKAGKRTRADVLAYVKAYNKEGVTKTIDFTDTGEIEPSKIIIWAYVVKNGTIVPEQEIPRS